MDRASSKYIVINHEEQYSVWRSDMRLPSGWKATGRSGTKKECLNYIEEVWTDMRPIDYQRIKDGKLPR